MKFILGLSVFVLCFSSGSFASDVSSLKAEILQIAKKNTTSTQNQEEVRQQLDDRLAQLVKLSEVVDANHWAIYAPGSWRQVWSDEADNSAPGAPKSDLSKVFQYVSNEGRAVNFGERILPNNTRITFALEAIGSIQGNQQNTKILNSFSKQGGLSTGDNVEELALDILNNELKIFSEFPLGEFPNGPINAESDLTILFLDDEVKIGTAPNVYTNVIELFVLEKVTTVQ